MNASWHTGHALRSTRASESKLKAELEQERSEVIQLTAELEALSRGIGPEI